MEKNIKLDYKKKYKDLYQPKITGMLIDIAAIPFLMVDGKGNPNEEDGDYSKAMQLLYGITFTIENEQKGDQGSGGLSRLCGAAAGGTVGNEGNQGNGLFP